MYKPLKMVRLFVPPCIILGKNIYIRIGVVVFAARNQYCAPQAAQKRAINWDLKQAENNTQRKQA